MKIHTRKVMSIITALALMASTYSLTISGVTDKKDTVTTDDKNVVTCLSDNAMSYSDYNNEKGNFKIAEQDIIVNNFSVAELSGNTRIGSCFSKEDALILEDGAMIFSVVIPENAKYNFMLNYAVIQKNADLNLGIKIDGEYPFSEAQEIFLPSIYSDANEVRTDDSGNEFSAEQTLYGDFVKKALYDRNGIELFPYCFAFNAGEHTISMEI